MFRVFCYFLGIFLISIGIFLTILDANVLTLGYRFLHFVQFISRRSEFWFLISGLIFIFISLERRIKNELLLRHNFKLERKKNS